MLSATSMGVAATLALTLTVVVSGGMGVAGAPDRTTQLYMPVGLYSTAQYTYWMRTAINDSLNSVSMFYDYESDSDFFHGQFKAWNPPFAVWWYSGYWKSYLEPSSALGPSGPLGHTGPLSSAGPIGKNTWDPVINPYDPSTWTAAYWAWFKSIAGWAFDMKVSLGEDGPLGKAGPLTTAQMYDSMYHLNAFFGANDFCINLDIFGVWGPLGPLGVMGPLGPLGALGPFGPHLLNMTKNGEYYRSSEPSVIVRSIQVPFDVQAKVDRVYDLVEVYPATFAQQLGESNDCSWLADGTVAGAQDVSQRFRFTSARNQSITAIAIPIGDTFHDLDVFLTKRASGGAFQPIASSALAATYPAMSGYIDWITWRARAGDVFELTVTTKGDSSSSSAPAPYRVVVLGTGWRERSPASGGQWRDADVFSHHNVVGPHQGNYCHERPAACV